MTKTAVTRRTVLRTALATTALAAPFVRRIEAAPLIVPNGKMTLAWHTNIAARWLDPQQHDGTASPDNFIMALHDGLIKNFREEKYDHLALAEKFDFAEDAKGATFRLRQGLKFHDGTLFDAVAGSDVRVVIGAASHWSRHGFGGHAPPPNVQVGSFDYESLRALYARASIVVVPLVDIDNQAGITTILEAMAMGKPVIVTQSLGQTDVVEDRRRPRDGLRSRPASLTRLIAGRLGIPVEATGFYVAPGDAVGLRRAIDYLLAHPDVRAQLGSSGRRVAEELFTVEHFAERMRSLVLASLDATHDGHLLRRALYG